MKPLPPPTNVIPFEPPASPEQIETPLFLPDTDENGKPKKTSANLWAVLEHKGWVCRYNTMTATPELTTDEGRRLGKTDEGQRSALVDACQRAEVPDAAIDEHLIALCQLNSYHPVREWLEGGEWDGAPRVASVIKTLNANDPAYAEAIIRPWLVAAVAAAFHQGPFISKLIPVLQGDQSFRKSAWIQRLASVVEGAIGSGSLDPQNKDSVIRACSCWVFELAELESTTRGEAGRLKDFITQAEDRYRAPYGRTTTTKKRQTVFFATVNGTDFLKDQTGNARFAVIEMAAPADMDKLNELLGWTWNAGRLELNDPECLRQFWLEVKADYDAGASWHLDEATSKAQAEANDAHTDKGPHYAFIVEEHLSRNFARCQWFTASRLLKWHNERPEKSAMWGRALSLLAREGCIESRPLRARGREYWVPIGKLPNHLVGDPDFAALEFDDAGQDGPKDDQTKWKDYDDK